MPRARRVVRGGTRIGGFSRRIESHQRGSATRRRQRHPAFPTFPDRRIRPVAAIFLAGRRISDRSEFFDIGDPAQCSVTSKVRGREQGRVCGNTFVTGLVFHRSSTFGYFGCHCWLVQQCRSGSGVSHCWTSQQWHPQIKVRCNTSSDHPVTVNEIPQTRSCTRIRRRVEALLDLVGVLCIDCHIGLYCAPSGVRKPPGAEAGEIHSSTPPAARVAPQIRKPTWKKFSQESGSRSATSLAVLPAFSNGP